MIKEKQFTTEGGKLLEKLIFQIMKEFQKYPQWGFLIQTWWRGSKNLRIGRALISLSPVNSSSASWKPQQLLKKVEIQKNHLPKLKTANNFEKRGNPKKSPAKACSTPTWASLPGLTRLPSIQRSRTCEGFLCATMYLQSVLFIYLCKGPVWPDISQSFSANWNWRMVRVKYRIMS